MSVADAILARPEVDSFWRFGESAGPTYIDDVGGISGTEVGSLTEGQASIVPGTAETSILFPDTAGESITFGGVYDFTGSAAFTAYCWLKPTIFDSVNGNFIWGNQDAAARGWSLQTALAGGSTFALRMRRGDNAGFDEIDYTGMTEATYENGVAKQVAMSYDGTNLVLNIDGVDVASAASSKTLVAPTTAVNLRFGAYGDGGSAYEGYAQYAAIFSPNLVEANLLSIFQGIVPGGRRIYKRLYGPAQPGTSAATLYTVPDNTITTVRRILANNPSGSPVDFTLSIGADAASTRIYDSYNIPAGGDVNEMAHDRPLAAGEIIQGFVGTSSTVVLTIDGIEESL